MLLYKCLSACFGVKKRLSISSGKDLINKLINVLCFFLCQLDISLGHQAKWEPQLRLCLYLISYRQVSGAFSWLMVNLGRSVHCVCVGGGAQPGLVVLRGLKQQAEQAKKHERPPPNLCFSFCFWFLPWAPAQISLNNRLRCGIVRWNKRFPHQVAFGH